ncbi:MAG: PadR family transcriptional regulator [Janibacter sp.]
MSLKHALLGVLDARPMSGYELKQFFDSSTGWLWSAQHSQIYPLLGKLEKSGLIRGQDQVRGEHLRRVVYEITKDGVAELRRWIGTAQPLQEDRDPFLLQAIFFDLIPDEESIPILEVYARHQRRVAEESEEHSSQLAVGATPLIRERLSRRPQHERDRIMALKALAFAGKAKVARARADWAQECITLLRR